MIQKVRKVVLKCDFGFNDKKKLILKVFSRYIELLYMLSKDGCFCLILVFGFFDLVDF